ncbi:MAG: tetratricopeptide repeat protein [Candidatus Omnitrophota bacterium]|nr:tetratricopeptide repeat protein [Candidatus Omnitrophota bacterium]
MTTFFICLITSFCCAENDIGGQSYFKGVEYAAQGRFKEAKQEYQKALSDEAYYAAAKLELHAVEDAISGKVKKEAVLLAFKGKEYAIKRKWEEAEAEYTEAIKKSPNCAYAFISRGVAYLDNKLYDDALSDFSEALDADPYYTETYYYRGIAYLYKSQFNKAISEFTKAIETDNKAAPLYFRRGEVYGYKDRYDMAIPDFDKAIELKPDYAAAYFNKAYACEKRGLKEEAIEAYKKFIQYASAEESKYLKDAKDSIQRLEAPSRTGKEKK